MSCVDKVYHYLKDNRTATPTELVTELGFSRRFIQGVLKQLLEYDMIKKTMDLKAARKSVYVIKRKR